jgi:oligopeptidase B
VTPPDALPPPPRAEARPKRIEQLGRVREDEYAWLKDPDWQAVMRDPSRLDGAIRAHLEAENAYMQAVMAPTEGLQQTLFEEMKGRIKEDDSSPPTPHGPFEYWSRFASSGQRPQHLRRRRGDAEEARVLLDEDLLAVGKPFFRIAAVDHSPDHRLIAYAADAQGSEYYAITVCEAETGRRLGPPIESAEGGFVFSADSAHIFWIHRDDNARPCRVLRRRLDALAAPPELVYEEPDEGMFLHLGKTQSGAFIVIASGDHETSEVRLVPADAPETAPVLVEPRQAGLIYGVEHWGERLVIRTNADGALDFKLVEAPLDRPGRAFWRDLVPHRPGRFLMEIAPLSGHLIRLERVDANPLIVVRDREGREREIKGEEAAFSLSLDLGWEYDTSVVRTIYESPTTPRTWIDNDLVAGTQTIRKVQEIPSGHDRALYLTERLHAPAPDGALVPITILRRAGEEGALPAPLFLYGYGSYGLAMDPTFSIRALSLVDRGLAFAIAHVRGGSEKGWGWFLDGRAEKKPNTFSDFIAAAEHLIEAGFTRSGRIVACGGSAGGLLAGAVANLRPDLFAGVIAAVPFVDVLNTMSDATLPLTPPEWPEWGNPLESEAAYDLIASYSPYDNVTAQAYPAILATGGLSDPRVTYWEPAKWIARLRARSTGERPALLKTNMEAGHAGAVGRFEALREVALEYAFALACLAEEGPLGTMGP